MQTDSSAALPRHPFKANRTLMVQGTTSDAGKSALVTALCRLCARQNLRVAPFKPQNMALNSAVTIDGGEIGRSQAVQAQAAGIPPMVAFNPILLKPNSDMGSQVIVRGHAIGHYSAKEYQLLKPRLLQEVLNQHDELTQEYERILVEGAGSPAEINLRANDIANMGFAEAVDCPVVLISDIDRGGVFAHLVGTLELLSEHEQARVCGFFINRFRGDPALLEPGIQWLEQRTGKPVLAVIPYLDDFHLEAEDALSRGKDTSHGHFHVVVATPPRISNHTDFDPLRLHPQISLHYARHGNDAIGADLIILPGSKNTRSDLDWLYAHGWNEAIKRHLRYGGKIIGICGGYQMLGEMVDDPSGVEGPAGSSKGFGLFKLFTRMHEVKTLTRVKGRCLLGNGQAHVEGYEIHAGDSTFDSQTTALFELEDGRSEGIISADGQLLGSYLHGMFDHPEALSALLKWAGLPETAPFDYLAERELQIERLATCVAQSFRPACCSVPVLEGLYQGSRKLP